MRTTVLRGSQSEPLPALLFFRSSSSSSICRAMRPHVHGFHHAETMACDCLARSTMCTKQASLSCSCAPSTPTSACRNSSGASSTSSSRRSRPSCPPPRAASAADGLVIRDGTKRKHNATTRGGVHIHSGCRPHRAALRGKLRLPHPRPLTSSTPCPLGKWWCVMLTTVTRLAGVDQHRPRREVDGIGHQNDELLRHEPTHVAHPPAGSRTRGTGRAARGPAPGRL